MTQSTPVFDDVHVLDQFTPLGVRIAVPTYSLNRLPSHLRWHVTLVMVLTLFKPGIVTAEAIRRVRDVGDAQIAQLINEGIHMSPTFRSLVEMIDATNGIVYVQRGNCARGARACLVAGNPGRRPESHPSGSREGPSRAPGAHRRDWA